MGKDVKLLSNTALLREYKLLLMRPPSVYFDDEEVLDKYYDELYEHESELHKRLESGCGCKK